MVLLRFLNPSQTTPSPTETVVRLGDVDVAVLVRHSMRAKRLSLKLDGKTGQVVMVLPADVCEREGLAFLNRQRDWVLDQIKSLPQAVPFEEGHVIPYRGQDLRIRHDMSRRYGVTVNEGEIWVAGPREHLARRLRDHCKKLARERISQKAPDMAAGIGRKAGRVSVRDQKTRWGSCSANGDMSFNWRLILAPDPILHYVVAHEVAHLVERNHSPRFWALVNEIDPNMKASRQWLRSHGLRLQRVG